MTKRGAFNSNPKPSPKVRNGSRERSRSQKKLTKKSQKSSQCWYDFTIPWVLLIKNSLPLFYVGVLKRLVSRIRRIRPKYHEEGSWRLLHDNAPSHRSILTMDYLTKNRIVTINHSPYSPDMAPCNFHLFGNLHSIIFLIVQIVVFSAKGTISKATNKMFVKENQFFVLELLNYCLYITFL